MTAPRGIRNHNPGNLRDTDIPWDGVVGSDGAFEVFDDAVFGIRAMAKLLSGYYHRRGLRTVREMVNRYAPPSENDTGAYVDHVADALGVLPDDEIELDHGTLTAMCRVMILHENGQCPYTWEIPAGVWAAGVRA